MSNLIPIERIESKIFLIRGQKVMLDRDLAELYGVTTRRLNEQVKRNIKRFPPDFMFSLTRQEIMNISQFVISSESGMNMSQIATSSKIKHSKKVNAFTENGVAMLSSVLRSERAIEVNIRIMRAFTRLRQIIARNKNLSYLFKELKQKVNQHDLEIGLIIKTIEKMIATETKPRSRVGFKVEKERK